MIIFIKKRQTSAEIENGIVLNEPNDLPYSTTTGAALLVDDVCYISRCGIELTIYSKFIVNEIIQF